VPKNSDLPGLSGMRRLMRDKAAGLVDHVVSRYFRDQAEQIGRLEQQVRELRDQLEHRVYNEVTRQGDWTRERILEFEVRARRDIPFAADHEAARQSAKFVHEQMPTKQAFPHAHDTLEHALSLAPRGGMALEFGVWTGTTLKIISTDREGQKVFGFDSFEGLPEDWRSGFPAGHFTVDGLPDVPGAELVVGWFDDTLPGFLAEHPGPVDFLHVDGDLYSSAKTVLSLVGPRLREGSVVLFDEFFNFPGWQQHEYRAWMEYVEQTGIQFTYEGYTWNNEQVITRVTKVGKDHE
jgi:hypothetical protein